MTSPPTLDTLPDPPSTQSGWPWTEASPFVTDTMPDGSAWPKISIVTPSYNQVAFLEKSIRSVLLQGYPNLEYIVIDGGSTDESVEIIEKYDPWIDFWVSESDRGQSHAINKGFRRASGEIFAWLNSDDLYLPEALVTVAQGYANHPEADVFVGEAQKVRENGSIVYTAPPTEFSFESFLHWKDPETDRRNFLQPACFFSKQAWTMCGPLREDLHYCMDVDLWIKMVKRFEFYPVEHRIALATAHDLAKTTGEIERTTVEISLLIGSYGGEEIARRQLMNLADDLHQCRSKISKLVDHPLYKFIGPIYRFLHDFFGRNIGATSQGMNERDGDESNSAIPRKQNRVSA